VIQGRELGGWDLALIRTLPTEPSEWGRTRMSAKGVRTVPCAEGASPDSEPHRGLCGPLCRTTLGHRARGDRCS